MDITWLHIHDNLAPNEQYLNMANVFYSFGVVNEL
jgi:hypothetical protein